MVADVSAPGWVYLVHPETGGSGTFPDSEDVLTFYRARGWEPGVEPVDEPEPAPESEPAAPVTKSRTTKAAPATESKE
jgi:hypothetical protein